MAASKAKQIEEQTGRDLRDILIETYERCGNQTAVARALGVSQGTLSLWLVKYGLLEWKRLVPKGTIEKMEAEPS